jgi:hypothetical protein
LNPNAFGGVQVTQDPTTVSTTPIQPEPTAVLNGQGLSFSNAGVKTIFKDINLFTKPNGLQAKFGMMYYISSNMASGKIAAAAYVSVLFAVVVAIYGIAFTRNLMDIARKNYVVEEGIFAA